MAQINPIGNNPFYMFNTKSAVNSQPQTMSAALPQPQVQQQVITPVQNNVVQSNDSNAQTPVVQDANKKKKMPTGLAIGVALAAGAGIIYAIKTGKFSSFRGKAQDAGEKVQDNIINGVSDAVESGKDALSNAGGKIKEETTKKINRHIAKHDAVPRLKQKPVEEIVEQVTEKIPEQKVISKPIENAVEPNKKSSDKTKDIAFVALAFGVGLIAKAFRSIKNSDSSQAAELKKQLLEQESYIKEVEIPLINQESQEYLENYKQNILDAIDMAELPIKKMRAKYNSALKKYKMLNEGSYSVNWDGTDTIKASVKRSDNGGVRLEQFDKNGEKIGVVYYNAIGRPTSIETYKDGQIRQKARYKLAKDTNKPYLAQYLIYAGNSKKASMIAFDENNNPQYYLARNKEGKLIKAFDINSDTLDVKTISLPDNNGEKWLKKFSYREDGSIDDVTIMPSNDLPRRRYNYESGQPTSMDLFDKNGESPILHVPFEENYQSEFMEK